MFNDLRRSRHLYVGMSMFVLAASVPASAQEYGGSPKALFGTSTRMSPAQIAPLGSGTANRTARAVGGRQVRTQIDGISPMLRVNNRVPNRLQNRLRNRIDRNYDPQANATSPFEVADTRAREAGKLNRR